MAAGRRVDRCRLRVVGRGVVVSGRRHLRGRAPVRGRWVSLAGASFRLWGLGVVCGRWVSFRSWAGRGVIVGCRVVGVVVGPVRFEPRNDDERRFSVVVRRSAVREECNGRGSRLTCTRCSRLCPLVGCHGFAEPLLVGMVSGDGW